MYGFRVGFQGVETLFIFVKRRFVTQQLSRLQTRLNHHLGQLKMGTGDMLFGFIREANGHNRLVVTL